MSSSSTFSIALTCLISHRDLDPETVSRQLELVPYISQRKGADVVTPKGRSSGDTYKEGKWGYEVEVANIDVLEGEVARLIGHLSSSRRFLQDITNTGGKVRVFVSFSRPGAFALELGPRVLEDIAAMGVTLGVEVFS